MTKLWRDASSLILIFRNSLRLSATTSPYDYSILMLKRSSKSKFMPNAYVFPGGVTDKYDMNRDWLELIKGCESPVRSIENMILKNVPRPLLLQEEGESEGNTLPKDIAFRIGAIRETFEEAGILLQKSVGQSSFNPSHDVLMEWREKVCQDPTEFYNMCRQFRICPDVWSL